MFASVEDVFGSEILFPSDCFIDDRQFHCFVERGNEMRVMIVFGQKLWYRRDGLVCRVEQRLKNVVLDLQCPLCVDEKQFDRHAPVFRVESKAVCRCTLIALRCIVHTATVKHTLVTYRFIASRTGVERKRAFVAQRCSANQTQRLRIRTAIALKKTRIFGLFQCVHAQFSVHFITLQIPNVS